MRRPQAWPATTGQEGTGRSDDPLHHAPPREAARPGERRQVWTGVVREALMGDTLDLSLTLDARQLRPVPDANLSFESTFEIELLP